MSFKSRPQTKKTGPKRKWDQGETATDSVAYANVKIYSISGGNLDKKEFGLTGMFIVANLLWVFEFRTLAGRAGDGLLIMRHCQL